LKTEPSHNTYSTHFVAGFFDFKNTNASFDDFATNAACFGSFRLPARDEVCGATTIPVDVNGLIPRLSPSSSLMTAIREIEAQQCKKRFVKFLGKKKMQIVISGSG
jgi:hypothetical protein